MFERFTDEARAVVVAAQESARSLRHGYLGTEHLLLGVLAGIDSVGKRALDRLGVEEDHVRSDVETMIGIGPGDLRDDDAEALRSIGIDLDEVRRRIEERFDPGALVRGRRSGRRRRRRGCRALPGHVPFTPRAKGSLEFALRESRGLGHGHIGTEHVLLGLARLEDGVAADILRRRGVTYQQVRTVVIDLLAEEGGLPGRSA